MKAQEIVELLQYRRHDLVNDMQVIHGYVSMNMLDKAQEKIEDFMKITEQERKLYMLQAPSFIVSLEKFRMQQEIFSLTYDISDIIHLSDYDEWLTKISNTLLEETTKHFNHEEMHVLHINVRRTEDQPAYVQLTVDSISPPLYADIYERLMELNKSHLDVTYHKNELTCTIQID